MSNNTIEMEALNQQMKEDIHALIDSGGLPITLLESDHSRVPPRLFLTNKRIKEINNAIRGNKHDYVTIDDPQDNTRLMPIARCQGKSVFNGLAEMVGKLNRKEAGLIIIDNPIKEQSFKKTPHEFSAELIDSYQKMMESIEGKEGASFSQRKFWEGQYMQSPVQQTNSAFGFTDIIKIEVSQSDYDKLYKVAIEGHDRIQLFFDCLVIDDVPIFIDDELNGVCKVYRYKDFKNKEQEIIDLAFYPENITPRNPEPIKYIGGV